jgi:hypothetical protein
VTVSSEHAPEPNRRGRRAPHLEWVPLRRLIASPVAQRPFNHGRAAALADHFDLEKMGYPVVSHRDDRYFVVDGQTRIGALRIFGFGPEDTVQCEVYTGLSEREECELFLGRNDAKTVAAFDRFQVAVAAGRPVETTVDAVVRHLDLSIGRRGNGPVREAITCVTSLLIVHDRIGPDGLATTVRVLRDSFHLPGFEGPIVEGIGLVLQRYGPLVDENVLTRALRDLPGGLGAFMTQAEMARARLGQPRARCIAATAVDLYNRARPGRKGRLAPWWAAIAEDASDGVSA